MVDRDLFEAQLSAMLKPSEGLKGQNNHFEPRSDTSAGFFIRAGFPAVIRAIDCTHILTYCSVCCSQITANIQILPQTLPLAQASKSFQMKF